jgi:hypothetical protein
MVRVVLPEPARACVPVMQDVGAPASLGEVVAGAMQEATGEEDAAAALQGHGNLGARAGAVDLDVDFALRGVDGGLVGMDGVALAAGDDVKAAVLGVGVVEGDPEGEQGVRIGPQVVGVLVIGASAIALWLAGRRRRE